jgi:hypothetical protein
MSSLTIDVLPIDTIEYDIDIVTGQITIMT